MLQETIQAFGVIPKKSLDLLKNMLTTFKNTSFFIALKWYGNELGFDFLQNKISIPEYTALLNVKDKIIYPRKDYEYDPVSVNLLDQLYKSHLMDDFNVETDEGMLSLGIVVKKIKNVIGTFPTIANLKYDHKSQMKRFGLRVMKEVWERPWYHATYKKYMSNIVKNGLQPSKTLNDIIQQYGNKDGSISLGSVPRFGWSSMNANKQAAVYLYMDKSEADSLAKYLAYRDQSKAIVLEIDGKAIKDYSKLTPDEDAFRNQIDGNVEKKVGKMAMPHFYQSVLDMRAIAYKGVIPFKFIKVLQEIEPFEID